MQRVAEAVPAVERTLDDDEKVTQFEADTAAAFVALAAARVEVAVIEAGLGGRLDATNVLPSRATVLTSIGLEHTEWLGDTELEIAAEKLAVLRDHSTLVLAPVGAEVENLARSDRRVSATANWSRCAISGRRSSCATPAPFARRNFAVALAAAEAVLGDLELERVREVAAAIELPGRAQAIAGDPPVILDAAHNPAGARALAEALPALAEGRPVTAVYRRARRQGRRGHRRRTRARDRGACRDRVARFATRLGGPPGAETLAAAELAAIARAAGIEAVVEEPDPSRAIANGRALARRGRRRAGGLRLALPAGLLKA